MADEIVTFGIRSPFWNMQHSRIRAVSFTRTSENRQHLNKESRFYTHRLLCFHNNVKLEGNCECHRPHNSKSHFLIDNYLWQYPRIAVCSAERQKVNTDTWTPDIQAASSPPLPQYCNTDSLALAFCVAQKGSPWLDREGGGGWVMTAVTPNPRKPNLLLHLEKASTL